DNCNIRHGRPTPPSDHDDTSPEANADGLEAAGRAELGEERGDVKFHRVHRDVEAAGDLLVGGAGGEQLEDFTLARRQLVVVKRRAAAVERIGLAGAALVDFTVGEDHKTVGDEAGGIKYPSRAEGRRQDGADIGRRITPGASLDVEVTGGEGMIGA